MAKLTTTCFLVFEPQHRFDGRVSGITVDRVVMTQPRKLSTRHVAVKLNFQFESALFEQFMPEVTVPINGDRALVLPDVTVGEPDPTEETGAYPADDDEAS
jgi:hypothetical protein